MNVALTLAACQKRLKFWNERFFAEKMTLQFSEQLKAMFKRYETCIAELAFSAGDEDADQSARREMFAEMDNIEREVESLFQSFRLLTNEKGVHSVPDNSLRGHGGSKTAV